MSLGALEYAWERDGLTPTEKAVLVCLADHANLQGDAIFPKIERIVRRTSLSRSTVMATRRRLEKAMLLERTGRKVRGVVEYRLPELAEGSESWTSESRTVRELDPEGSESRTQTVRELDPEQVGTAQQEQEAPPIPPEEQIWATYVEVMRPRRKVLDAETKTIIRDALKVASVEECQRAIFGCSQSEHHMGQNDRGRRYNRPSHILKGKTGVRTTREQIDMMLDYADKSGSESRLASADHARVRGAKRAVLDAAEFPGDRAVVERGEKAEAWLVDQGWKVERDDAGIRFVAPR